MATATARLCSRCSAELQATAAFCARCGQAVAPPTLPPKKSNVRLFLILGVFGLLATCVALAPKPQDPDQASPSERNYSACLMAQQFVERRLKAPSTAKFASCGDAKVTNDGYREHAVIVVVDAQNSFGAMIRSSYAVKLKYEGSSNWRLVALDQIR